MANTNGRLVKELQEVSKDDSSGVKAAPVVPGNLRHLKGEVDGPVGTPYAGGKFEIDIVIPPVSSALSEQKFCAMSSDDRSYLGSLMINSDAANLTLRVSTPPFILELPF
jgi:hypothetical protein